MEEFRSGKQPTKTHICSRCFIRS